MTELPKGESRLAQLLGFLEHDPGNLALIADAAGVAVDEGEADAAAALFDRYAALAPLPPALLNLKGLAAMREKRFAEAAAEFEALRGAGEDGPVLRFNLAWALTMAGDHEGALALLDDEVLAAGARAAALKVNLLHALDRTEEALAEGAKLAESHPDDTFLMGALASAALDADQIDLARLYAGRAGTSHDGLTTLGMLLLDDDRSDESGAVFDRVLAGEPDNPRALLGKGLGLLNAGDLDGAAARIDAAARRWADHLGSWVAAGWVYYLKGDLAASRERFETALALDDNFAETQGALAVLDLLDGEVESARRRTGIALRLDRGCFAAALATSMLLERDGKGKAAQKVRDAALNVPVGVGGKTIAQAIAARGGGE